MKVRGIRCKIAGFVRLCDVYCVMYKIMKRGGRERERSGQDRQSRGRGEESTGDGNEGKYLHTPLTTSHDP